MGGGGGKENSVASKSFAAGRTRFKSLQKVKLVQGYASARLSDSQQQEEKEEPCLSKAKNVAMKRVTKEVGRPGRRARRGVCHSNSFSMFTHKCLTAG